MDRDLFRESYLIAEIETIKARYQAEVQPLVDELTEIRSRQAIPYVVVASGSFKMSKQTMQAIGMNDIEIARVLRNRGESQ